MPILKRQDATTAMKDAIVLDMADLRRQAARIIAEAKAQAQKILDETAARQKNAVDEARQEALQRGQAEGLQRGLEEGRRQGHAQALKESSERFAAIQKAWVDAAKSWEAQRAEIDAQARQDVLLFAFRLAEKVIHRAVEVDPGVIAGQVGAALARVLRPMDVSIHIHPDDRPALDEAMPQLLEQASRLEHVRLVDDPSIERGGCVVHYGEGQIDATIETQLQRIAELVMPAVVAEQAADAVLPEQQAA